MERCGTTKVTEATKTATKASPYSPTKNTTKASSVSPLKVLVEVAQPSHKVGSLHNKEAPNIIKGRDRDSHHQDVPPGKFPQQEIFLTRIPTKET